MTLDSSLDEVGLHDSAKAEAVTRVTLQRAAGPIGREIRLELI